jgi:uncharacterized membrane protein YjfL (UPF0719 family)
MIVSLTKIYCPSELQQNRTPTVYRNVTQYNNTKNTAMDKRVDVLFYKRSHGQYILVGYAVIAVFVFIIILCDVLTVYQIFTEYNSQQKHSHNSVTATISILVTFISLLRVIIAITIRLSKAIKLFHT